MGQNWRWLEPLVRGAALPPETIKEHLKDGRKVALTLHADSAAFLVLIEATTDQAFWVWWINGAAKGRGPKALARLADEVVAYLEPVARAAGCTSIQIMGRDWSFLPGFVPAGDNNHILKVLQ